MSAITEYIAEFIQDPLGNVMLLPTVLLCSLILLLLIWLLTRDVRLWYWKVNKQISALDNIDKRLQELGDGLVRTDALSDEPESPGEVQPVVAVVQEETMTAKQYTEDELEKLIRE